MGKLTIVLFGDSILRSVASPVKVFNKKLLRNIDSMAITLSSCEDGAALAAPQVNISKRIIIIDYEDEYIEMINPEILSQQGEQIDYEGCLSFPGFIGKVKRFHYIKVKYNDSSGVEHIIERSGRMAVCIQHEYDHLDGVLFIDRMIEDDLINVHTELKISRSSVLSIAGEPAHKD